MHEFMGPVPKIGIRPTIDGRRQGVREGLEEQTVAMARAAAALIGENVRLPDGRPAECVIAKSTIGGVAEAAACEDYFSREGVCATLTVTPCWCYGSETMDMNPLTQKAVWGFNGTERPGAVYLAAVMAAHAQKGLPAFAIYGRDVQDRTDTSVPEDVREKILSFARSALACGIMRGKSYLSMGSVSMGIAGSMVDPAFFEDYLGMRVEYADMSEFLRRMELGIFDKDEYEQARAFVKAHCVEGKDFNAQDIAASPEKKEEVWDFSVKMALIAKDMMAGNPKLAKMGFHEESMGHNAVAAGFQGQRQWTDHYPNGDFMETMLNSSFDWTGLRRPYIVATENDCLNGAAMLLSHLLTGTAQVFADVRTYWSPDAVKRVTGYELEGCAANGIIHLINSGSAALDGAGRVMREGKPAIVPFWEQNMDEAMENLKATQFHYGNLGYFRGGGWSTDFCTKGGMPLTMARISITKGLGPMMQIAEGYSVELPADVHDALDLRTDPAWPTTWFAPRLTGTGAFAGVYELMAAWSANHGALCYGHVGAELITLAAMLRIPVALHNVSRERVFRPHLWGAFGTEDLEGADFRACAAYGPLYGL